MSIFNVWVNVQFAVCRVLLLFCIYHVFPWVHSYFTSTGSTKWGIAKTRQDQPTCAYKYAVKDTIRVLWDNLPEMLKQFITVLLHECQAVSNHRQLRRLFNSLWPRGEYMPPWTRPSLVQIMACRLLGAKPLSEPMLTFSQFDHKEENSVEY